MELFLNDKLGKITLQVDEAAKSKAIMIFAHGAGAGMDHLFMKTIANRIREEGVSAVRFNFPYMEHGKKSPGSPKNNIEAWKLVITYVKQLFLAIPLYVAGKSYGGRMASHLLADEKIDAKGIIYFGFPLHAPGKDSKDRANHLSQIQLPQLFLQGSNDKLANIQMMNEVVSDIAKAKIEIFEDADHSFKVPKKSGKTDEEILDELVNKATNWMKDQL